ncbi:MAG TPA: hypothetical protein PLU64_12810, partial [Saprospiraceae bacterium]|nr:hypothetical protein [Saprospiraceae bacterium]
MQECNATEVTRDVVDERLETWRFALLKIMLVLILYFQNTCLLSAGWRDLAPLLMQHGCQGFAEPVS